jgi:hypothetical protein
MKKIINIMAVITMPLWFLPVGFLAILYTIITTAWDYGINERVK